jgi:hypothetical protein
MATQGYSHLVEISEADRRLTIFRLREGKKELYTQIDIPNVVWDEASDEMKGFCRLLGENILLDSPQARKLLQT